MIQKLSLLALSLGAATAFAQAGFDVTAIDRSVSPCQNFYQFACGNWLKNNPIPSDRSTWGRFNELQERNLRILQDILETEAAKPGASNKSGRYYKACMDEAAINRLGTRPIKPLLEAIDDLKSTRDLTGLLVRLHTSGIHALFHMGSEQDMKNAAEMIAGIDQGGLGLPERDYYFKDDARSVELREQYVAHVARMLKLLGEENPAEKAKTVMAVETALARGHLDVTSRRNPDNIYHRLTVEELAKLSPAFDWRRYLEGVGAPVASLNVAVPDYSRTMEHQIRVVPLDHWKAYFRWHTVHGTAALLPDAFVNEDFEFYGKTLTGAQEIQPRWKRCVQYTNADLGEDLGRMYVERTFGEQGKTRTLQMVRNLERAMERDISELDWMTPATKKRALEKLHAIANKIGYPETWRDYSALQIETADAMGNSLRANAFEFRRKLAKIGKPVDKKEWHMTPPTVNAYYDPQNNNINFPAGILQPPFYDNRLDDAVNYGAIGGVIGHELTHGFDDQGGRFDAKGNLADWWTAEDRKEFDKRAECVDKQYSDYVAVGDLKLNGKLTLGENVADNGGLRIAYMALLDVLAADAGKRTSVDGFTPQQRFFLGWGQVWCQNITDEASRLRTLTDPHSLARYRVNGVVSNMPEFGKAFGCSVVDPMVRADQSCRVW
jgi:endothelin-converting enzyme/putative endopeptidase